MKNEFMARAMSCIDDALIEEANESSARRARILRPTTLKMLTRFSAVAAVAVMMIGVFASVLASGNGVLLYGENVSDSPRTITEYMPRAVTHVVDPSILNDVSLPLELEFRKETTLTLDVGTMSVIDRDGKTVYTGNSYTAKGAVSICVQLPPETARAVIMTNRGYDMVLTREENSGVWLVNIEK